MLSSIFFRFFPVPHFLQMSTAGLDITDNHIRVVELTYNQGCYQLKQYNKQSVLENTIVDGEIQERDVLVAMLKEIKEKNKLEFVRVSLPEEKSYLYYTSVPYVDDPNQMREAVEYTIEGNVPLSSDNVVFDYQVVTTDKPNEGKTIGVVVSVLPKSTVDLYITLIKESGMRPVSLMVESQAITRAVIPSHDTSPVMVLNVGDEKTAIYIVNYNIVHFTSSFSTQDGSVGTPVDSSGTFMVYDSNTEGSVKQTQKDDYIDGDDKHVYSNTDHVDAIDEGSENVNIVIPSIVKEINRVLRYWNSQQNTSKNGHNIQRVVLCGNYAYNELFKQKLESNINLDVEISNVWTNACSLDRYIPQIHANEAIYYAASIGLALPYN